MEVMETDVFFTLGWAKPAKPPARFNFFDRLPFLNYALHFALGPFGRSSMFQELK